MNDVLPPQAGLTINNVIYRYTANNPTQGNMVVNVRNVDAVDGGYIFSETDDWSGTPGNTIIKTVPTPDIPIEYWGDGEINVEGVGTVSNPSVFYTYKFDPCFDPMSDPSCPGYEDSIFDWLQANVLVLDEPYDPYNSSEVQDVLNRKYEDDDEKFKGKDSDSEENDERRKLASGNQELMADAAAKASIFESLAMIPNFETYYDVAIDGGVYNETIQLQDSQLPDNPRAMRSLASDSKFEEMVRSQYR